MTNRHGLVRLPKRFFEDHRSRDLPTPTVMKETQGHYWVRVDDADLGELLSDAKYYTEPSGPGAEMFGLRSSAIATVNAIDKSVFDPHQPNLPFL